MDADLDLRWQVRLRSRADLDMVRELTGVLAALTGSTHGQVIAEAVRTYATARLGEHVVEVLEEVAKNLQSAHTSTDTLSENGLQEPSVTF